MKELRFEGRLPDCSLLLERRNSKKLAYLQPIYFEDFEKQRKVIYVPEGYFGFSGSVEIIVKEVI